MPAPRSILPVQAERQGTASKAWQLLREADTEWNENENSPDPVASPELPGGSVALDIAAPGLQGQAFARSAAVTVSCAVRPTDPK